MTIDFSFPVAVNTGTRVGAAHRAVEHEHA